MKSELTFQTLKLKKGKLGQKSSVPDLVGGLILQNNLKFYLDEEDEIYEGYGRCRNSYPYRQFSCYSKEIAEDEVKTVTIENDFLKAVFLPELGGRLWSLWDKEQNKNLLYTNDVIRFRNLAVRNAWFSGGVEWNIGVIGHSPFTTAPLFTAVLEDEDGTPILRMYEYERVRQVTYQMDFWLREHDRFLNARMRIMNSTDEVVPMYWWSNIAVPEHECGRIIVPAKKAYTFREGGIHKVDIPIVNKIDITTYRNIPSSVDYFFEISKDDPKYIINVDENGYGLLHMSTNRLQSRKLFSWGRKRAADHWQEFLTERAGRYVEIQAGLGKTQYGCLPMAPHTAWEWLERYGAVQLGEEERKESFEALRDKITTFLLKKETYVEMEQMLFDTKKLAKKKASVCQTGSGYGALKNQIRHLEGKPEISEHLDFTADTKQQKVWADFLETGILKEPDYLCPPPCFVRDELIFQRLKESIKNTNKNNWYAHYQMGIFYFQKEEYDRAETEFKSSLLLQKNPWAYHGLASVYTIFGEKEQAKNAAAAGIEMKKEDISYVKDSFRLLDLNEGYKEIQNLYVEIGEDIQEESRIKFYYIHALSKLGQAQKAFDLLCADGGMIINDIREGEISVEKIWKKLYKELYGTEGKLPYIFDFTAI